MIIEAGEPVREPTRARFEERDPQRRVAFAHATEEDRRRGGHLLERMRAGVTGREPVEAVPPDRGCSHPERLVDSEYEPLSFELVVEAVIRGIVEIRGADMVRSDQHADEAQLGRVPHLARGQGRRALRHDTDRGEASRVSRAVVGDPVVVRPTRRGGPVGVQLRKVGDEQAHRREQHRGVDALRVHRPKVGRGVEAVLELVGEEPRVAAQLHRGRRREVQDLPARWRPGVEEAARLDDMGVGVEDPEAVMHDVRTCGSASGHMRRAARAPSIGMTDPLV